jgi:prepilin-type N-terminal cleavage/methylation domain-containing protein
MADKIRKVMRGEKGFTLVEMMVVLIIIAMLIVLGIWAYIGSVGSAKMTNADGDITTIQAALDAYYSTNQSYPLTQIQLISAGISPYEVTTLAGSGPAGTNPPYLYGSAAAGGPYFVSSITSVNGQYMVGNGTSGVSSPATLSIAQ